MSKPTPIKAFLLSMFLLTAVSLQAQTLDEWFRQKKTQREYLVQQIAALQAYTGVLREGYTVLRQGISTVEHIKNGDLGLHQAFFVSFKHVNPAIGGSARIADILRYQTAITRGFQLALPTLRQDGQLTADELEYLEEVKARVLASCAHDLEALWLILTENELELGDAGRLGRLEELYAGTLDTFAFTQAFLQETHTLTLQRAREKHEHQNIRSLYSLPQ